MGSRKGKILFDNAAYFLHQTWLILVQDHILCGINTPRAEHLYISRHFMTSMQQAVPYHGNSCATGLLCRPLTKALTCMPDDLNLHLKIVLSGTHNGLTQRGCTHRTGVCPISHVATRPQKARALWPPPSTLASVPPSSSSTPWVVERVWWTQL